MSHLQIFDGLGDVDPLDGSLSPELLHQDSLLLKVGKLKRKKSY
jgi:hypothetical protein